MLKYCCTILLCLFIFNLCSCRHEPLTPTGTPVNPTVQSDNFPDNISKIMTGKCATAGCHNAVSYTNAGSLLLDSWEHLFDGGNSGAVVIPYDVENSSLLYFINTHADLGPMATPTMPLDRAPLNREEYITIRDWIANGAPDKSGNVPFSTNAATRQKIYITHQGCDLVGVIDAEKKVLMRYIRTGKTPANEIPDHIQVSADGMYAYVCFWNGNLVQKIDLAADKVAGEISLTESYWKNVQLSADGSLLFATNWQSATITVINTANMTIAETISGFQYPESIAFNAQTSSLYITERFGNTLCKRTGNVSIQKISIDGKTLTTVPTAATPNPYRILMSGDQSKYFISCEQSNEIRVFDAQTDALVKTIPVGRMPQEMALSASLPYLFVTCLNDTTGPGVVGSVYAVNYNTYEAKRVEGKFFQPHGIAVDDRNGVFYVFSRNQDKSGPRPHHISPCNGRNGYYSIFSTSTLQPYNGRRYEISVDPYAAGVRFK